jgi:hypothetical protein
VQHLADKGVKIEFNSIGDNAYFPIPNIITINTRQNIYSRYYSLLHETGHYLLRQKADFSTKYLVDHSMGSKNKDSRIDVLREEIAAWDMALQFAEDNGFDLDKKKWDHYSKKFIYQYAMWTVFPQKFNDD